MEPITIELTISFTHLAESISSIISTRLFDLENAQYVAIYLSLLILENYFSQKWEKCLDEMKSAKNLCNNLMSEYYDIMTDRINEFKANPLPNDWDGIYVATSK